MNDQLKLLQSDLRIAMDRMMLAHLLRAVGGSISFSGTDLSYPSGREDIEIELLEQKDPWMVILKLKEPDDQGRI